MGPINKQRISTINEYIFNNMITKERILNDDIKSELASTLSLTVPKLNNVIKVHWDDIVSHPRALEIKTKVKIITDEFPFIDADYLTDIFNSELDVDVLKILSKETVDTIKSHKETPITKYIPQDKYTDCTDNLLRYLSYFSSVVRNRILELLAGLGYKCDEKDPRLNLAKFQDEEVTCTGRLVRFGTYPNTREFTMLLFDIVVECDDRVEKVNHLWFPITADMFNRLALMDPRTLLTMKANVTEYKRVGGERAYGLSRTSPVSIVQDEIREDEHECYEN